MIGSFPHKRFASCQQGSIAVISAIVITALVLGTGIAVDYGSLVTKRNLLQTAADASSIGTAREMALANSDTNNLTAVANKLVTAQAGLANASLAISISVDEAEASVQVTITETWTPFFAHLLSSKVTPITVSATAQLVGSDKVCVLALEPSKSRSVQLKKSANLTATNCGVYANSTNREAIYLGGSGTLAANLICSAGGAGGDVMGYQPAATVDCPPMPDPLMDRTPPSIGSCDHTTLDINDKQTLSPGVYCNDLTISGDVTFEPGIYIIKDGSLAVVGSGQVEGENVGFYLTGINPLTGKASNVIFGPNSSISLTAPKDGDMAGILLFEDRNHPISTPHRITSNDARMLLGTLYLSRGTLVIDANAPVADQSAYTAIIANKLNLDAGPNLVLNADYGATDIPVPSALSGVGGRIVLAE